MSRSLLQIFCVLCFVFATQSAVVRAETYNLPFADLQQIIDSSDEAPDSVIRAYLAGLIRDELDALGFDVNGGLVLNGIPLDEITEIIETDCNFPRPFEIHTDATTATLDLTDDSSLTIDLDSIRSIGLHADLAGTATAEADAWVRWGWDIPFGSNCVKFETDHGWIGLTLPFGIDLDLALDLNPSYDAEQIAIVVDKHATISGQADIQRGALEHDFGTFSLTDVLIAIFEDQLLDELRDSGEQAIADEIATLNLRLDGLDENGILDPTIEPFNAPTVFALEVEEDDQAFVRSLLDELGVPDFIIEMLADRGIEILLQLAILEGAEREAYLAELGATASCDVLLAAFEMPLANTPIYAFNGQSCEVANVSGPDAGSYFADAACADELAFSPTDIPEFCLARFGDQAETLLGNAAAWTADSDQPNDPLPAVASRSWTTTPGTQLDVGVIPLGGNQQPFLKQLSYKTISGLPRGNGSCELEMRVYKRDIGEQGLKPAIALHGGTWQHRGFSFFGLEAGVSQLTERGFIVFAPFYRLVDDSDGNVECNGVSWREVTADVETALDWVKQNGSALGAADGPVNVYGQSAGAQLAAWLAAQHPADVRKALLFYAPTDVLEFLAGAVPAGGPYEAYRDFGMRSISRFFGAQRGSWEVRLNLIDYSAFTPDSAVEDWPALIPDAVFELSQVDPLAPPAYLARCASATGTDLAAVSLTPPPDGLLDCLRTDLGEFLISNSLNHQLGGEAVPIHVVHGSADTLVPYEQALALCEAIDGNAQPVIVVDPLTTYACGLASEVQIVKDAEHAFELGVCLDPLCPAGDPNSATRDAAALAMDNAYNWLFADPPPPPPVAISVHALPDVNTSGSSDIAVLMQGATSAVHVRDGASGALISNVDFGADTTVDVAMLPDLDGSGAAEIVVLGEMASGQGRAQVRDSVSGSLVANSYFGAQYAGIQLSVVDDYSGNGLPELAVLGRQTGTNDTRIMVRDASSGTFVTNIFLGSQATADELVSLADVGSSAAPELGVLGILHSNGQARMQVRDAGSSALQGQIWFGDVYVPHSTVTMPDVNGNGSDEVVAVGVNPANQNIRVQVRDSATTATLRNIWLGNTNTVVDIGVVSDTNDNGSADIAILLETPSGTGRIRVQDGNTGAFIRNVFYNEITSPKGLAVLADYSGNGSDELAVLGDDNGAARVQVNDSATGAAISTVDY